MEAYVLDAVRTPRGKAKATGALHGLRPVELVAQLLGALEARGRVDRDAAEDLVLGCVTQVGDQGANVAKTAALYARWPESMAGMTVNRFCASGLDAIGIAAARVHAGMAEVVLAGGVESMSRVAMFADRGAWFADPVVSEATGFIHMGVAADLLASVAGLRRDELDAYAASSHRRAETARGEGHFADSLIPMTAGGACVLDHDELVRPGTTIDALSRLAPLFADAPAPAAVTKRYPSVSLSAVHTIGTAPGIADGASLVAIAGAGHRDRAVARVRAVATHSVEPVQMLHGNVGCTRKALALAGMSVTDVDLFEVNESFAAVPLHYQRELGLDPARVNVSGGAIAMGHPLGASGGVLVATLIEGLRRTGGSVGVASICGGAGVATTVVIEGI